MSKHKKGSPYKYKSKKGKKYPGLEASLDLAGGLTMAAIAANMEQKNHYSERGKVNPYAVSAFGIGTGMMNSTGKVLKTGTMLCMIGAFDEDENYVDSDYVEDPIFSTINYTQTNDNRYAWRMNCEDGSAYGINPEDYETREEYNEALSTAREADDDIIYASGPTYSEPEEEDSNDIVKEEISNITVEDACDDQFKNGWGSQHEEENGNNQGRSDLFEDDDFHVFIYCQVRLSASGETDYFRTEDRTLKCGDLVVVPSDDDANTLVGEIVSVEHHMSFSVPKPLNETEIIIGRYGQL